LGGCDDGRDAWEVNHAGEVWDAAHFEPIRRALADVLYLGANESDHGPRYPSDAHPVTYFVFDVLQFAGRDPTDEPWEDRLQILDYLDLVARSGGAAGPTFWSGDGEAMHQATRAIQAEGTVSKRSDSLYRGGRSRQWRQAKHKVIETLQVVGWRASTPGRPGGVLLADRGQWVGVGTLNLLGDQRAALVDLVERFGQRHSSGMITIPRDCVQAVVRYTARTPTHGHLREAFVVSVEPATSEPSGRTGQNSTEASNLG
jgi:hypothetical protein